MTRGCVYRHFSKDNELLYVGCSSNFINRQNGHRIHTDWFQEVTHVTIEHFPDVESALDAEDVYILNENPKYNKRRTGPKNRRADKLIAQEKAYLWLTQEWQDWEYGMQPIAPLKELEQLVKHGAAEFQRHGKHNHKYQFKLKPLDYFKSLAD